MTNDINALVDDVIGEDDFRPQPPTTAKAVAASHPLTHVAALSHYGPAVVVSRAAPPKTTPAHSSVRQTLYDLWVPLHRRDLRNNFMRPNNTWLLKTANVRWHAMNNMPIPRRAMRYGQGDRPMGTSRFHISSQGGLLALLLSQTMTIPEMVDCMWYGPDVMGTDNSMSLRVASPPYAHILTCFRDMDWLSIAADAVERGEYVSRFNPNTLNFLTTLRIHSASTDVFIPHPFMFTPADAEHSSPTVPSPTLDSPLS